MPEIRDQKVWRLPAVLLLLAMWGQMVLSAPLKSPTYDEAFYLVRGAAFVKLGDLHMRIGEPVLLNALNALPLLLLPDLRLPVDEPSWTELGFHAASEAFMWRVNPNPEQILFLGRLPTMALALLLAAFCGRWAGQCFGRWGALLTLFLCAFDPNLIAHGRLATTDLGGAALILIAAYWTWQLLRRPTGGHLLAAGLALGLAQAARFTALILGPALGLLFLARALDQEPFAPYFFGRRAAGWAAGDNASLHSRRVLRTLPANASCEALRRQLRRGWLLLAASGVLLILLGYLAVWAAHGFQVGPVAGHTTFSVPAPSYWEQLLYIRERLARPAQAFLMGELYTGGRWSYFFLAFLWKTPLPALIAALAGTLLGLPLRSDLRTLSVKRFAFTVCASQEAFAGSVRSERLRWETLARWLPPVVLMGLAAASSLNLGYRYILPVLPFLWVTAGRLGAYLAEVLSQAQGAKRALTTSGIALLLGWSAWGTVSLYPHYLAFFNELAGGPDNGWRLLVDSNLDWGQDLKGLKRWMEREGVERIKLGYMGEDYPAYYGITFDPLPSLPDRWAHPAYHDLYPADPAPGVYAISASLLQGLGLPDPDTYAWFRERTPEAKIGYSIFVYRVPVHGSGRPALVLSGLSPADIRPQDYARLGTNDVRILWCDAARALIIPSGADRSGAGMPRSWLVTPQGQALHPALAPLWPSLEFEPIAAADGRALQITAGQPAIGPAPAEGEVWHLPAQRFAPGDPADHGQRLAYPVLFGGTEPAGQVEGIELIGYQAGHEIAPGGTLVLTTYWRVRAPASRPLKLFVHLLDAEGTYRGGEDRLDIWYDNWQPGDLLVQVHEVPLAANACDSQVENAPPGRCQVELGWYDPQTMQRLPVVVDGAVLTDRVLLAPVESATPE